VKRPPKISDELDEETLALIIRKQTYQDSRGSIGNCECCGVALDGSAYDVLRQGERRCQVCRMLGNRKDKFQSGE
jgi:hypothetical protein